MNIKPDFDVDQYCDGLAKAGTEHAHQRAFFGWLNYAQLTGLHPMARMCFAIPNGGKRDPVTAARLKSEGVKAGVPDVCYPVPSWKLHNGSTTFLSLWLELKKPDHGVPSEAQDAWRVDLHTCGHAVATCWGWRAARQAFNDYAAGRFTSNREYR